MCTGCERRDGSRGGFLPIASQKGPEERRERVKPGEEESGTHVPPDCAAARGPFCDPECEVRPPARLPGRLGKRGRPRAGCDQRVGGKGIGGPSGGEAEDDGPTDARTAHSLGKRTRGPAPFPACFLLHRGLYSISLIYCLCLPCYEISLKAEISDCFVHCYCLLKSRFLAGEQSGCHRPAL